MTQSTVRRGYALNWTVGMFDATVRRVDKLTGSTEWKIVEIRRMPSSMWEYATAVLVEGKRWV